MTDITDKLVLNQLEEALSNSARASREDGDWILANTLSLLEQADIVGAYVRQDDADWERRGATLHDYVLRQMSVPETKLDQRAVDRLVKLYVDTFTGTIRRRVAELFIIVDENLQNQQTLLLQIVRALIKKYNADSLANVLQELTNIVIDVARSNKLQVLKQLLDDEYRRLSAYGPIAQQTFDRASKFDPKLKPLYMKLLP